MIERLFVMALEPWIRSLDLSLRSAEPVADPEV